MRFRRADQAIEQARMNALHSGVSWVVFSDTSGAWNAERYRCGCAAHEDRSAVLVTPARNKTPLRRLSTRLKNRRTNG